jgi:heat-inducible transcriptional repressor
VGSHTLSHLIPVALSSASIRNTMAELTAIGLVAKPHASAGRVPTERGLRLFVDGLLAERQLEDYERRDIADAIDGAPAEGLLRAASDVLSQRSRALGFVVAPRVERLVLRHVSLVRLSSERVLAILVTQDGVAHRRTLRETGAGDQVELDRIGVLLSERVAGRTLAEAREGLAREAETLRSQADRLRERALAAQALTMHRDDASDVFLGTWLALLDQPEFRDPQRLRELLSAIDTKERLLAILDQMLPADGPGVAFGHEIGEPGLRQCALVVAPYGAPGGPLGVLGVLGPSRMDYARVIPLVHYLSEVTTERLGE